MTLKRLLKVMLLPVVMLFALQVAVAQNRTVTGKVTDAKDGSPIAGASVVVKGMKTGTLTGVDGSFSISISSSVKALVVTSVGYSSSEIAVGSSNSVNVALQSTADALADVVVIGYGSRKSKDVTGSVSRVTEKDFNKGQIASPEQLLQGRTPGVLVTPSTGEPGAAATINIRGTGSISGSQEPLYVIDGVPLIQGGTLGSASGVEGSTTAKKSIDLLEPK